MRCQWPRDLSPPPTLTQSQPPHAHAINSHVSYTLLPVHDASIYVFNTHSPCSLPSLEGIVYWVCLHPLDSCFHLHLCMYVQASCDTADADPPSYRGNQQKLYKDRINSNHWTMAIFTPVKKTCGVVCVYIFGYKLIACVLNAFIHYTFDLEIKYNFVIACSCI